MARRGAPLLLLLLAIVVPASAQDERGPDDPVLRELVRVERVLLDVRALDSRGRPIPDLQAADFRLRVDGEEVAVESVEWIDGALPDLSRLPDELEPESWEGSSVGRLVVLFFQRDLNSSRLKGLMRMSDLVGEFVDDLRPEDRAALVVHDTNLKLYSDFTADRAAIGRLLDEAIVRQTPPPTLEPGPPPSLLAHITGDEASGAADADQAMLLLARALDRLPGSKVVIYVGWGLSRRIGGPSAALGQAAGLLIHGRVTMYSLDVTDADYHTLEGPLAQAALETGGFYVKTHVFSELAINRVEHALAGHYELAFVKPELPTGRHSIDLALRGRKGDTYHRRFYDD